MSARLTFREIDDKVNQTVLGTFDLKRAVLFGVNDLTAMAEDVAGETSANDIFIESLTTHGDIYMMLDDEDAVEAVKPFNGFGVLTCGWAAPVDNGDFDGPPSEHPQKRRVKLFCYCDTDGQVTSSLRFQDDPDEVIMDPGQARGSLADAVHEFNKKVRANA